MKNKKVALYSLLSQILRVISGPLTIVMVAKSLSDEEMSFYYSFFNVIALQQILEMGFGFVLKQYMAHAYKTDDKAQWTAESKKEIKSFLNLSFIWFSVVSFLVLIGIGPIGYLFFSGYNGAIDWSSSWVVLVGVTAISVIFIPCQILVEGCQEQVSLYKARVGSALASALVLCICLYFGAGLFSVAISLLFSNLILNLGIATKILSITSQLATVQAHVSVRKTASIVWPMLSKVSVTWIMGYFFWNSFNLIAFKTLPIEQAGRFGFTLNLARAGFSIAESLVASQTTIYSSYISSNQVSLAKRKFEQLLWVSICLLIGGYLSYLMLGVMFPHVFVFSKALSLYQTALIFLYFILLLPVVLQANFCRCFKQEPYFYISMFCNIQVPVVFFAICYWFQQPLFEYMLPFSIGLLVWSYILYQKVTCDRVSL